MHRGNTGHYQITTAGGETIRKFIPFPLPPSPPLELTSARQRLLEQATLAVGRLDAISLLLPDPSIFLYAYVRREAALVHVQFETIHPFLDGNGRVGRLLIAFILHHGGVLKEPLLYPSLYFKQHWSEYYHLLDQVRAEGDWEAWLDFFLAGVEDTASNAVRTAQSLVQLFKEDAERVRSVGRGASSALRVFTALCERPIITLSETCSRTGLSFPTASKSIERLVALGIARELTGGQRNRVFAYDRYLAILDEGTEPL